MVSLVCSNASLTHGGMHPPARLHSSRRQGVRWIQRGDRQQKEVICGEMEKVVFLAGSSQFGDCLGKIHSQVILASAVAPGF